MRGVSVLDGYCSVDIDYYRFKLKTLSRIRDKRLKLKSEVLTRPPGDIRIIKNYIDICRKIYLVRHGVYIKKMIGITH